MKAPGFLGSSLLLAASFALTMAMKHMIAPPAAAAAATELAVEAAPAKSRHREESAFSEVRAKLRAGDFEGARSILRKLGERDPTALFELLAKLPGFPGVEDIIRDAAGRLPWDKPEVTVLLNGIGPHAWRDLAWGSYTLPQSGIIPDEEILKVGHKADTWGHLSSIRGVMEDAAKNRTESFLAILNKMGGTSVREEFFEMMIKHHPELADQLFPTIPDGSPGCNYDRGYVLQVRSRCLPTASDLMATLEDTGTRGMYSNTFAPLFASQAYKHATAEERGKILESIVAQPALARNRLLAGPLLYEAESLNGEDFAKMVGLYTSGYLQQEALKQWLEEQPKLDPADRKWVDELPTEKLKASAQKLLDERAAAPKAK